MGTETVLVINGYDFVGERVYGIQRNARELTAAMDSLLDAGTSRLHVELAVPQPADHAPRYRNIEVVPLDCAHATKRDRIAWRSRAYPAYVRARGGVGLDMTLDLPCSGRFVVFDYDCIRERYAKVLNRSLTTARRLYYEHRVRRALDNAELVFSNSAYARDDIAAYYGCDRSKMHFVYCAWQHMLRVRQDDSVLERLGLKPGDYFFSLGSRFPYKNFRWVECAARQNPQYRFVVSGSDMHLDEHSADGVPDNMTYAGYLSDEEVKGLEAHCRAFLHPSLAEGFGIPPLEAMSCGARCVVSTAGSLPEVYGDSVWYVDPTRYDHIDLDEILGRPLAGTNEDVLARYSWERSARQLMDVLEREL